MSKALTVRERDRHSRELARAVTAFESPVGELQSIPDPPVARLVLWTCLAMIVAAVGWASFAKLPKVVVTRGDMKASDTIPVQPFDTGIVKSVEADVGQVVHAGQVLMTLDPTFAEADVAQLEVQARTLDAAIARLEAEAAGRAFVPADTSQEQLLQQRVYLERQVEIKSTLKGYDDKIEGLLASIRNYERTVVTQRDRLKKNKEIEEIYKELEAKEIGSKVKSLAAQEAALAATREYDAAVTSLEATRHQLEATRSERQAFESNWRNKALAELTTGRRDRGNAEELLAKARRKGDLVSLTAPADAIVLDRAERPVGSVLKPGEPVFTLIPLNAPLEAEIEVNAADIGFIKVGDPVDMKLDAYNYMDHGALRGKIRTISESSFKQEQGSLAGRTFYKARVQLAAPGEEGSTLRNVPAEFRVLPGLPLQADITVGQRTVMSYILRPIVRGFDESMREP